MISVRILFWNTGGKSPIREIVQISQERSIDLLILAEFDESPVSLLEKLNSGLRARFHLPFNLSKKLTFFVAGPPKTVTSLHDDSGVAVRHFRPLIGQDVVVVGVHLPSKLHMTADDQAMLATRISQLILRIESKVGHSRTMIIGDFNMNPFEPGIVSSEGFHAVMARSISNKGERTILGEKRRFFYNPMWSLLGDSTPGAPGTYYYSSSSPIAYFWNTFDQVLLRPELCAIFEPGDVTVIDRVETKSLLTSSGVPNQLFSDHLPIYVELRLEDQKNGST